MLRTPVSWIYFEIEIFGLDLLPFIHILQEEQLVDINVSDFVGATAVNQYI